MIEGFDIPIHRSLTQTILLAGAPREITIINGTFTAALVLGLHTWYGLPIGLALHVIAVAAAKKDPQFFATFRRQLRQKSHYSA